MDTTVKQRATGIKQVAGQIFEADGNEFIAMIGHVRLSLGYHESKCYVTDPKTGFSGPFRTVTAAKLFAKRLRHGRSLSEHFKAEALKAKKEELKLSLSGFAKKIGKSPKMVESYFSGHRAIPEKVYEKVIKMKGKNNG